MGLIENLSPRTRKLYIPINESFTVKIVTIFKRSPRKDYKSLFVEKKKNVEEIDRSVKWSIEL